MTTTKTVMRPTDSNECVIAHFLAAPTGIPRRNVLRQCAKDARAGHIIECGVRGGNTINLIAEAVPTRTVHGFDSFEGLPAAWDRSRGESYAVGEYSVNGTPPPVQSNVVLYKGMFADTLPEWAKQHPGPIALLHVDCDIYSSTRDVLEALNAQLVHGTMIVFDELIGGPKYVYWYAHEWRALNEWRVKYARSFRVLYRYGDQAVIRIHGVLNNGATPSCAAAEEGSSNNATDGQQ